MNLRRQYSLPNCTLILDGLSDDLSTPDPVDNRPLLSILLNMECSFVGLGQKITGGRALLENLVKAVNFYAQESLSGLPHPQEAVATVDQVKLEKIEENHLHRLIWYSEGSEKPQSLDLTTIQLFDLIEAVDQFVADTRTIPSLALSLAPLSRRYRQPDEPLAQRVVPATVGMLSLLIIGSIGFLLPIPEVNKPDIQPVTPTQTTPNNSPIPPTTLP